MFTQIDHIGLAVRNIGEAVSLYTQAFGVDEWEHIELPERHMAVAVAHVGETMLELIAPTSDDAAFAKFLRERGPGMHHVAYRVADINAAIAAARSRGLQMIDEQPRIGLHHTLTAFIHPKSTMGVLIEFVQHPAE